MTQTMKNQENKHPNRDKTHKRSLWNSELFYNSFCPRNRKGEKDATDTRKELIINQPTHERAHLKINRIHFLEKIQSTNQELNDNTIRRINQTYLNNLLYQLKDDSIKYDDRILISNPKFKLKTRGIEKSREYARNRQKQFIKGLYRGFAKRRVKVYLIKQHEKTIPDFETFSIPEGFKIRFFFYDFENDKQVTRLISSNAPRVHPTRKNNYTVKWINPNTLIKDAFNDLFNEKEREIIFKKSESLRLPLIKIRVVKPYSKTIWTDKNIKKRYRIRKYKATKKDKPTRENATHEISIDYKRLARAEKRISKNWFKILTESLTDESKIIELPIHLKKLRNKIIISKSYAPTLKKQKKVLLRKNTVIEYNHALKLDDTRDLNRQRAKSPKLQKKVLSQISRNPKKLRSKIK